MDLKTGDHKNLLDSLNIGYALLDMNENILEVNETLLKMTEERREDVVGHHLSDVYEKIEYESLRDINQGLQKNLSYQFEYHMYSRSGEKIPVLFNISINLDNEGRPVSENVMITDIREQKRVQAELERANQALRASRDNLEKEKKKLEAILFGIGDCVTIFDLNGNLLLSNPKGKEIRGERRTPLLPLKPGDWQELTISTGSEQRQFLGKVEEIRDHRGHLYAYVETLKDITHQRQLKEKEQELFRIKRELKRSELESRMIGVSKPMHRVFDLILRCAEVDSTVLVLGETGVGKEMAARAVHAQSPRKDRPFVAVNCGALPETLLESELFGHMKGAFTGAISERRGMFREADGGVLFLDEVGDLSLPLQVKLLRALQEKEIRPLGSARPYPVDVRVMAATNRNLEAMVEQGRFREDLYYRIAVIPLHIPPLRERVEDILPLAEYFIKKHTKNSQVSKILDSSVKQILLEYPWSGNVRELENCIEYVLAMSRGSEITVNDLPAKIVTASRPKYNEALAQNRPPSSEVRSHDSKMLSSVMPMKISDIERMAISNVLHRCNGNRTRAAKELGISRTSIWRKIIKYNIHG